MSVLWELMMFHGIQEVSHESFGGGLLPICFHQGRKMLAQKMGTQPSSFGSLDFEGKNVGM